MLTADVNTLPLEGNEKIWRNLSESDLELYLDRVVNFYHAKGYPHYKFNTAEKELEYKKLLKRRIDPIVDHVVSQSMVGLGLCWSYFPHAASIKCGNSSSLSPMEVFNDKERFKKTMRSRLKHGTYLTESGVRKALRVYHGAQGVSNFRPTAAASLYSYFADILQKDKIVTWDMSAGFGGRLLGALMSNRISRYIATDPSSQTFAGLIAMVLDMQKLGFKRNFDVSLRLTGSEDFVPDRLVDLAFTSPPYFDTERYSLEETQSYKKFDTYDKWLAGFLQKTLVNAKESLRLGGLLAINVANVRNAKTLAEDAEKLLQSIGMKQLTTLQLALSKRPKNGTNDAKYRYEPIFVFQKV